MIKKIKIFCIIIFIISIWFTNKSYAAWSCQIKNAPASALDDYISNVTSLITNVTTSVTAWTANPNDNKNDTISVFNEIFDFSWYYSYFRYYAVFPISNEVPSEITRDYKLLEEEYDELVDYLKILDELWQTEIVITNACTWVTWCDFDNKTAKFIIWKVLENNDIVSDIYRLTVIWEAIPYSDSELILVNPSFKDDIKENYWAESISACNEEWDLFEKVEKAIKNISLLNNQAKDWIKEWQEAWQLLIWNRPDEEAKIEKEELRKYLWETWVSTENQKILNTNLDKYNMTWIDKNNNFVTNSINSIAQKASDELEEWKDVVSKTFFDQESYTEVSTNDLHKVSENSKLSKSIQEKITLLYAKEIPFATVWDIDMENLRAEMIETHFSLDNSINTLTKACKKSVEFCNRQDKWNWKCWKCK